MGVYIRVDEPLQYLCFTANTAGSQVQLTQVGTPTSVTLETSTDNTNWSTYTIGSTITLSNIGDKIYFRNSSETDTGFSTSISDYYKFVMSGSIAGSGDINTLLNKNSTENLSNFCYCYLFYQCAALTSAPNLPSKILSASCYRNMFRECAFATPPKLEATTLGDYCYFSMFDGNTNLSSINKLDTLVLSESCYGNMYRDCSKIKLSTTQTGEYQTAYRIPTTGTGTDEGSATTYMFRGTGGTFTGTPTINTTYYTSNTVI